MNSNEIWFTAKRFGWGWGLPCAWQGWVVLAAYLAGITTSVLLLPPTEHEALFFASIALLSAALILISWLKGEPPRWRWGE